jgi:MFS transporter, putative metabolite:H+ symporter
LNNWTRKTWIPVLVGALGYFVDIYDLVLFSIVRVASLRSLGVAEDQLLNVGVTLLNAQMFGMLLGGVAWGILGDKRGRLSVLFGSILMYSIANIANGLVQSVEAYAAWRFIAGLGLAGELGAAITLVSEILPKESRGYGTAIVAGVGLTGAVVAGLTGDFLHWRTAYFVGGAMGLVLLVLRIGVFESGMYRSEKMQSAAKGDLRLFIQKPERLLRFLACVGIGIPIWCVVGILMTFAPEFAVELNIQGPVTAGWAILFCYVGVSSGDLLSGFASQYLGTRKKVVSYSLIALLILIPLTLFSHGMSNTLFYTYAVLLGLATGYWAVFITMAAEHFGTNLRATVATSVPNLVRGTVVIITSSFRALAETWGLVGGALIVCLACIALGFLSLRALHETYGRDLDFLET